METAINIEKIQVLKVRELKELDEHLIESFLDFQEALHRASNRGEILRSRSFRKIKIMEPLADHHMITQFISVLNKKIIAHGNTFYRKQENDPNPDAIELFVQVHPEYRRNGIGTFLLKKLKQTAKEEGRNKYEAWFAPIDGPAATSFCKSAGLTKVIEEKSSRLYKGKINWDYIKQQQEKHKKTLERYNFIKLNRKEWAKRMLSDEDMAVEMADFITEVVNLIPKEDIEANDYVERLETLQSSARQILETPSMDGINYYALDENKIIAMSGTYFPLDPPVRDVGTGLTGVRKDYQRQGLASLMKAMVIEYYTENHPDFEYIFTENAQSNEGMLSININLGFEYAFSWEMWQKKSDNKD